ncbi:MAG: hypothetical protein GY703_06830 [Gammaproteobacteria bacterium]|nr:hypothetical protein [Gammaproteobacteria bacterium]
MHHFKGLFYSIVLLLGLGVGNLEASDFSGDWRGSWFSGFSGYGAFSASLDQTGTSLNGMLSLSSTACESLADTIDLPLTGVVSANSASFDAVYTCQHDGSYNELRYTQGELSGDTLSGNYTVISNGRFFDAGTFQGSRESSGPCSGFAGDWNGSWLETSCDGVEYSGSWTGRVGGSCNFSGTDNWDFATGTIDPTTKILTATGVSSDGCGAVSLTGTLTDMSATGDYSYSLGGSGSFTGNRVADDCESDPGTGCTLSPGDSVPGNIESGGDMDWFKVQLIAGRSYLIDLEGAFAGQGTLISPYLSGIYDNNGALLPETAGTNISNDSHGVFMPEASGSYFLVAGAYGLSTGTYQLTVRANTPPAVVSVFPPDGTPGVAVDSGITIQFDRSMETVQCQDSIELEDSYDSEFDPDGLTVTWSDSVHADDTMTILPNTPLRHSMGYILEFGGGCRDLQGRPLNGYWEDMETRFSTAGAAGDTSTPRLVSTWPYEGQVGGSIAHIFALFDKPLDPATVTGSTVAFTGPGDPGYRVKLEGGNLLVITPDTPLPPETRFTVSLTTGLADAEGHGMEKPRSWSFNTGTGDTAAPVVTQVYPLNNSVITPWNEVRVYFSENMDASTINEDTVTVIDETTGTPIAVHLYKSWVGGPHGDGARAGFEIKPLFEAGGQWIVGHNYRVELGSTISDQVGNSLGAPFSSRFSVMNTWETPPSIWDDDAYAKRLPDGKTQLYLSVDAASNTNWSDSSQLLDVDVSDLTQSGLLWNDLQSEPDDNDFVYKTQENMDEALVTGYHEISISVAESGVGGNGLSRTFGWGFYVFNSSPTLTGPANGATVSQMPTLQFDTSGVEGAAIYTLVVIDSETGKPVFQQYLIADGRTSYEVAVPESRALEPGKSYLWVVIAQDNFYWHMGEAWSEIGIFSTGAGSNPADLSIQTAGSPDPWIGGQEILYTTLVQNIGPGTAPGTLVSGSIPSELEFLSATPDQGDCTWDSSSRILTCSLGEIASGSGVEIRVALDTPTASMSLTHTVTVSSSGIDPVPQNNTAAVVTAIKDPTDYDDDGMSNDWESRFNLNPWDGSDAGNDPDRDGKTNKEEHDLGRNPKISEPAMVLTVINSMLLDR